MTTGWNVLSRFRQLITTDDSEAEKILPLCIVNLQRITAVLSDKADEDDVRITEAAAALTYYDYALKLSSEFDNIESFKAGDITVSKTTHSLLESAETVKKNALLELTPLLCDTNFVFINV